MWADNISKFPIGQKHPDEKHFSGVSYLCELNKREVQIYNVTFSAGCRNNWHIHHGNGQILVCVGGHGWYQEEGKSAQYLSEGDVLYIPPEIKHWHGAVKNENFAHLAISAISEGGKRTTEWLEKVSDENYNFINEYAGDENL